MSLRKWTCTECNKEFEQGNWTCADGQSNHVVEPKEYLMADAPSDPGHPSQGGMDSKRDGKTRICNIPPDERVVENGEVKIVPGGYVEFIRGRFSTSDPKVQYYLEKTRSHNFVTEAQWQKAWLSQGQQLEIREMQLKAAEQRVENERNELLTKTQKKVKETVPA